MLFEILQGQFLGWVKHFHTKVTGQFIQYKKKIQNFPTNVMGKLMYYIFV